MNTIIEQIIQKKKQVKILLSEIEKMLSWLEFQEAINKSIAAETAFIKKILAFNQETLNELELELKNVNKQPYTVWYKIFEKYVRLLNIVQEETDYLNQIRNSQT